MSKSKLGMIYLISFVVIFPLIFLVNYTKVEYIEVILGKSFADTLFIAIVPTVIYSLFSTDKDKKEKIIE